MKVYADIRQEVHIDPKSVIEKLIERELGGSTYRNWVKEKDGDYYLVSEESAGRHSYETEEPITKKKYDYIKALRLVLEQLKEEEK